MRENRKWLSWTLETRDGKPALAVIVNGITDPRVQCPGGNPETFHVGPDTYPCEGDGCTVTLDWTPYQGTTEMWCRNAMGDSAHVVIEVPEIELLPGLALLLVVAWVLSRAARSS
jgi:hypothetical protein